MGALFTSVEALGDRLRRLEEDINRAPVRMSGGGVGGATIRRVFILPPIPTEEQGAEIIFLKSINLTAYTTWPPIYTVFIPVPNEMDTYWWAGSQSTEWTPIGGKLGDLDGAPGNLSAVSIPWL